MTGYKRNNSIFKILTGSMLSVAGLAILLVIVFPIKNTIALKDFAKQLYQYDLPAETVIVEKEQLCGDLVGNDHKIDFLASILIKTSLDEKEIKKHYFKAAFKSAKANGGYPSIEIFRPKCAMVASHYLEDGYIEFEALDDCSNLSDYMIIVISSGGYDTYFDIRMF